MTHSRHSPWDMVAPLACNSSDLIYRDNMDCCFVTMRVEPRLEGRMSIDEGSAEYDDEWYAMSGHEDDNRHDQHGRLTRVCTVHGARLSRSGESTSPTTISALACPFLVWFPRALHAACM